MDKNLTVYPISTGNELNIFSNEHIDEIKIMDMRGHVLHEATGDGHNINVINISTLPADTYIVEVAFENKKKSRSVFVKL